MVIAGDLVDQIGADLRLDPTINIGLETGQGCRFGSSNDKPSAAAAALSSWSAETRVTALVPAATRWWFSATAAASWTAS